MELIESDITRFLRTNEGDFERLALDLYAYQFERNLPYQAYNRSQGMTPDAVHRWQDIPAVPVSAFKSVPLTTFPVGRTAAVFESSATTSGKPSRHYLKTLTYYEMSLKASFSRWMLDDQGEDLRYSFLILTPPPAEAPRSSLSWMMDVVKRSWGVASSDYFIQRGRLDEPRLARSLKTETERGQPVALLGTTIAFLSFFEFCAKTGLKYVLPSGSRLMDTGGMKTQKREVLRAQFVQQAGELLGIPENQCVNEYGMCEMSSQFYGHGRSTYLEGPSWVRTLVIDPESGQEAKEGTPGLLRHFDLANVDSVLAIQTEDLGRAESHGFTFLGRSAGADLKGCSLSAEQFLT